MSALLAPSARAAARLSTQRTVYSLGAIKAPFSYNRYRTGAADAAPRAAPRDEDRQQRAAGQRAAAAATTVSARHYAVQVPDFGDVRKESGDYERRSFNYLMVGGLGVAVATSARSTIIDLVHSLNPSKDVLALASVEVDLATVPEGVTQTFKWRGKPLFVFHRTAEQIKEAQDVDVKTLRDQESDADRAKNPKYLVTLGVCTHLGCVPMAGKGDYGGYFCPCHGSHYDTSGRIRLGPAPLNLEVPPYKFLDDTHIVVG